MERRAFLLGLLACAVMGEYREGKAQGREATRGKTETIWTGQSGGSIWKWTTADLTTSSVSQAGQTTFSAKKAERRLVGKALGTDEKDRLGTFECTITPLSVVGTLISYQRDYYWDGGAHPSGDVTYVTVDTAKPYHPLSLTELFPDSAILKALLTDPVIQKVMAREKIGPPKTAGGLVKALNNKNFGGNDDDMYEFTEDLLSRFAFHHLDLANGQVAVRLNVRWAIEVFRFQSTQIGLLLPIPQRLRAALTRAEAREQGFLMKDAKRLTHDKTTSLFALGKPR